LPPGTRHLKEVLEALKMGLRVSTNKTKRVQCDICDNDGYVCQFPGPVPFTGAWCDAHFEALSQLASRGIYVNPRSQKELNHYLHNDSHDD
jgi:hypothetical protein